MTPTLPKNNSADHGLTDPKFISNTLLRTIAAGVSNSHMPNSVIREFGRAVRLSLASAFWFWSTAQSLGMLARSISISVCPSLFRNAVCCVLLIRSRKQVVSVAASAIVARMAGHLFSGVFPAHQKQCDAVGVPSIAPDVEAPVSTSWEETAKPWPAGFWSTRLIHKRPEVLDLIWRKMREWSSLVVSHCALLSRVLRSGPLDVERIYRGPFLYSSLQGAAF